MKDLQINTDPKFDLIFSNYPHRLRDKIRTLRNLVIETARETDGVSKLEETLKWGEPSFVTKSGSTLRMDWKPKNPGQYAMYFNCSSLLVETFRQLFEGHFDFDGDRAI